MRNLHKTMIALLLSIPLLAYGQSIELVDPPNKKTIDKLLFDPSPTARCYAAYDLGNMGDDAKDAVPALIHVLHTDMEAESTVRVCALVALSKIPSAVEQSVYLFGTLLRNDGHSRVRIAAAYALGQLGYQAEPVLQNLVLAIRDKNANVRRQAAYAISQIVASVVELQEKLEQE